MIVFMIRCDIKPKNPAIYTGFLGLKEVRRTGIEPVNNRL